MSGCWKEGISVFWNNMFERFYRSDPARSSATNGYGIGLSIAKAVTAAHRGRITAESRDGHSVKVTASFPTGSSDRKANLFTMA